MVLLVTGLMLLLTTAFLSLQQGNFSTLAASQRQREALLVAQSAVAFVQARLEEDQQFARQPFSSHRDISPDSSLQVHTVSGSTLLRGQLLDVQNPQLFEVSILNNLDQGARPHGSQTCPRDSAWLAVTARSSDFVYRAEVLLRGEPLYDASLTANGNITFVENPLTRFSSTTARNWVRSNKDISFSEFVQSDDYRVQVEQSTGRPRGVIWAKGDILSNGRALTGGELGQAQSRSGGILAPRSRLHNDIYKLEKQDLKINRTRHATLNPGRYLIDERRVHGTLNGVPYEKFVKALTFYGSSGEARTWYDAREIPDNLVIDGQWDGAAQILAYGGDVELGSGPDGQGAAMVYTFGDDSFTSTDSARIEVDGDLIIESEVSTSTAFIRLKNDESVEGSGAIVADGHISIQGRLHGSGALVAEKDIWLMAHSDLDSEANAGVVLYGRNVNIFGGNDPNVSFKGLVYAADNFFVHGGVQKETIANQVVWVATDDTLDSLFIDGAVVAQAGAITVVKSREAHFRYNEDYITQFTRGLGGNHRKLEQMWWRSM